MRDYLKDIEIVGAVLVYREGNQARWALDWLYKNCDRVCIVLDNHNKETEDVVMEYRDKYPERTHIGYSNVKFNIDKNEKTGYVKKRFKTLQGEIREEVCRELRKMHKKKPIDMLIWPDSDETFIDEFPKYLERFWKKNVDYMMIGFVEVYENFSTIIRQYMAPHGRVYKYKPELSMFPWRARTRYNPYYSEKRPWKVRYVCVHTCQLNKKYRKRRKFYSNNELTEDTERDIWILPKDVRKMTAEEISQYQIGPRGETPPNKSISLKEYLNNKKK